MSDFLFKIFGAGILVVFAAVFLRKSMTAIHFESEGRTVLC